MRAIPQVAIDFVKQAEKCKLSVYLDSGGKPTVGYGHTGGILKLGTKITQEMANEFLQNDLKDAYVKLAAKILYVIPLLTDNQYSALLSFVFNCGTRNEGKPEWTIWKRLNAKQFDQVPLEFAKFVNCNGKKIQGLVNRRNAEIALWSLNEPGSLDVSPPSNVTRVAITEPTPADAVPASKSKTMIAGLVSVVASVPVAVQSISAAMVPYADKSNYVSQIIAALAFIGAIAAGLTALWYFMHKQDARN